VSILDFPLDAFREARRLALVARPAAHRLRCVRATLLRARARDAGSLIGGAERFTWFECGGRKSRV